MQITFESPDPQAAVLRTMTERRARQLLKRLSWLAPRVKVHMSDVNGPLGGIDKRCQVEVTSSLAGPVVVTSMARDWRSALQSALSRAARTLLLNWQRSRTQRHSPPSVAAL